MALDKISKTIQEFREDVLSRGGPQISSMYQVILNHPGQSPIVCYPLSVIVPGRQFMFYEHDLWGTIRKIPFKRGYTQCHMSFIVYQDWAERTYIETWMNSIVRNSQSDAGVNGSNSLNVAVPTVGLNQAQTANAIQNSISSGGPLSRDATFSSSYEDYVDYAGGIGSIAISFLNAQEKESANRTLILREVFPAAISQMSMASDGTAYPTFNATFQFNSYLYT